MAVQTFNPRIKVVLKKTVRARAGVLDRFKGAAAEIDLSPFLGEGSVVTTSRGINQPAGGFTIRVSDRLYPASSRQVPGAVDSLYALVEPMDVVEIRMAREHGSDLIPLVMRGIVSSVKESEAMGGDGRPERTVTISGQDWGKWLQILQIKYLRGQPISDTLAQMTGALLQYSYGIAYLSMPAGEFIKKLIDSVINPFIFGVVGDENGGLPAFRVDVSGADPVDTVFPQGYQANPQGTMWTYLSTFGNVGPFYEVLIDDEEAGPTLVYRKPPYYALDGGAKIFSAAPDPEVYKIPALDVISVEAERSDADVANWYFVQSARTQVQRSIDVILQSLTSNTNLLSGADYPNSARSLFGTRLLEVETQHGALFVPGAKEEGVRKNDINLTNYLETQIALLKASNQDNVMFENGPMTIKGSPLIRPGRYFELSRRDLKSRAYITNVTQTFEPFRSFRTSLQFIRGTGFSVRSKRDGDGRENPYRAHIGRGVYE